MTNYSSPGLTANDLSERRYVRPRRAASMRDDMLGTLSDAVRDNPMSAALIGMGALWLFMGGSNMSLLGGKGRSSLLGNVAEGAGGVAKGTVHAASSMGSTLASTVSSTASGVAETVSDAASRMGDYVSGSVRGVDAHSEYRNPTVAGDSDTAAMRQFGAGPQDDGDALASLTSFRGSLQDLFERHPIALGVAGVALGAGIAASLPMTSVERDTLSKAGEAARGMAGDVADQAKEIAGAMADEVRQSASGNGAGQSFG